MDAIGRQQAIDALRKMQTYKLFAGDDMLLIDQAEAQTELIMLPPAKPEQRWILCSERLPRQGQEVICQCRANIIKVLKLDANGDWYQDAEHCYMSGFVVAWILLPELYQGGDGNETRINNRHQS